MNDDHQQWIELTNRKQFSRLLYTNPVCFLASWSPPATHHYSMSAHDTLGDNDNKVRGEKAESQQESPSLATTRTKNVMTLSWLTATNNKGEFIFSLNKRRCTANNIAFRGAEFVLSVPVKGMEELVLAVGRSSGRWGSKFPCDSESEDDRAIQDSTNIQDASPKKIKRGERSNRIDGLLIVPFGNHTNQPLSESPTESPTPKNAAALADGSFDFAIEGTVAHLKCQIKSVINNTTNNSDMVDDDHWLCSAVIHSAWVHPLYWCRTKNQFRPINPSVPPYLTFFGSQEFGYVCAP